MVLYIQFGGSYNITRRNLKIKNSTNCFTCNWDHQGVIRDTLMIPIIGETVFRLLIFNVNFNVYPYRFMIYALASATEHIFNQLNSVAQPGETYGP